MNVLFFFFLPSLREWRLATISETNPRRELQEESQGCSLFLRAVPTLILEPLGLLAVVGGTAVSKGHQASARMIGDGMEECECAGISPNSSPSRVTFFGSQSRTPQPPVASHRTIATDLCIRQFSNTPLTRRRPRQPTSTPRPSV